MFLQLRYAIGRLHYAFFEKNTITPLGRWKLKHNNLYSHFGNIDNDIGLRYYPMK